MPQGNILAGKRVYKEGLPHLNPVQPGGRRAHCMERGSSWTLVVTYMCFSWWNGSGLGFPDRMGRLFDNLPEQMWWRFICRDLVSTSYISPSFQVNRFRAASWRTDKINRTKRAAVTVRNMGGSLLNVSPFWPRLRRALAGWCFIFRQCLSFKLPGQVLAADYMNSAVCKIPKKSPELVVQWFTGRVLVSLWAENKGVFQWFSG